MYRMHRWFSVIPGHGPAARQYLSEITTYLANDHGVTATGFIEVFGPSTAACHLMIDFEDLASFEGWWNRLAADPSFGDIQAAEHTIGIAGTTNQSLLHSHSS